MSEHVRTEPSVFTVASTGPNLMRLRVELVQLNAAASHLDFLPHRQCGPLSILVPTGSRPKAVRMSVSPSSVGRSFDENAFVVAASDRRRR